MLLSTGLFAVTAIVVFLVVGGDRVHFLPSSGTQDQARQGHILPPLNAEGVSSAESHDRAGEGDTPVTGGERREAGEHGATSSAAPAPVQHQLATTRELDTFLAQKEAEYGLDVFFGAVEIVYANEPRDPEWAVHVEKVIAEMQLPLRGGCHTSVCIFRVSHSGKSRVEYRLSVTKAITERLSALEPSSKVVIETVSTGQYANTMYVFDAEPPAAYVSPLLELLPKK
ncbi:MAG: hypothetical protein ACT4PK_05940 [Gammaproteobacteria bacterium]